MYWNSNLDTELLTLTPDHFTELIILVAELFLSDPKHSFLSLKVILYIRRPQKETYDLNVIIAASGAAKMIKFPLISVGNFLSLSPFIMNSLDMPDPAGSKYFKVKTKNNLWRWNMVSAVMKLMKIEFQISTRQPLTPTIPRQTHIFKSNLW